MFARVCTYRAKDVDQLLQGFEGVTQPLEQMPGFSHAYFMVDRSKGTAMSMTVWETEAALVAGAAKAQELRRRGTEASGGWTETVQQWEIGLTVGTSRTDAAATA